KRPAAPAARRAARMRSCAASMSGAPAKLRRKSTGAAGGATSAAASTVRLATTRRQMRMERIAAISVRLHGSSGGRLVGLGIGLGLLGGIDLLEEGGGVLVE